MSAAIEHNEAIKPTQPEQIGAAAGAKLGAEYAANMQAPKAESSVPDATGKHLTNLHLTDANGNAVTRPNGNDHPVTRPNGDGTHVSRPNTGTEHSVPTYGSSNKPPSAVRDGSVSPPGNSHNPIAPAGRDATAAAAVGSNGTPIPCTDTYVPSKGTSTTDKSALVSAAIVGGTTAVAESLFFGPAIGVSIGLGAAAFEYAIARPHHP